MRDSASKSAIIVDGVSVGEIDDSVKQMTLTEAAGSVILRANCNAFELPNLEKLGQSTIQLKGTCRSIERELQRQA